MLKTTEYKYLIGKIVVVNNGEMMTGCVDIVKEKIIGIYSGKYAIIYLS